VSNCCAANQLESTAARCPQSGSAGSAVDLQTVKALLTETALGRLEPSDYRFCADARCDVVYFNAAGSRFSTNDVRVPVWQKLPAGNRLLCYCFGESEATIQAEIDMTGRSTAADRIRQHIAGGRCACEIRNPKGRCCLGDVIAAVKRVGLRTMPHAPAAVVAEATDVS
jgi:hypothetical protein